MPPLMTTLGELITFVLLRALANFLPCLRALMRLLAIGSSLLCQLLPARGVYRPWTIACLIKMVPVTPVACVTYCLVSD